MWQFADICRYCNMRNNFYVDLELLQIRKYIISLLINKGFQML
jgi:hypothetical protein